MENRQWHVCITVPYSTHIWQVRDSSEQNRVFKNEMKQLKQYVLKQKTSFGLGFNINKTDIMGLVWQAWKPLFANIVSTQKALAERGWNPLTYVLLDHPDILGSTPQYCSTTNGLKCTHKMMALAGTMRESLDNLNTEVGLAGSTPLIEFRAQQWQCDASYGEDGKKWHKNAALEKIEASTINIKQ